MLHGLSTDGINDDPEISTTVTKGVSPLDKVSVFAQANTVSRVGQGTNLCWSPTHPCWTDECLAGLLDLFWSEGRTVWFGGTVF